MVGYKDLFLIDKYRGKPRGIKFTNNFITWLETWVEEIKKPEELSLFK